MAKRTGGRRQAELVATLTERGAYGMVVSFTSRLYTGKPGRPAMGLGGFAIDRATAERDLADYARTHGATLTIIIDNAAWAKAHNR